MYYQSNQWMLSNVSVWWQNVVTMMYSLQWGIASYHLAVRCCQVLLTAGSIGTKNWRDRSARHGPLHDKLTLHPGYALWDIPLFFQIEAQYLTCREQLQAKQLRQYLKLMKTLYTVCYAQVDWYTNTSHKNCRQTMCNVVHSVRLHVEKHPCTMLWLSLDLQ